MSTPVGRSEAKSAISTGRQGSRPEATRSGRPEQKPKPRAVDDVLFVCLLLVLAWAPFWLGGNRPIAWTVNVIAFSTLILAYEAVRARQPYPVSPALIGLPLALFAAAAAWVLIQTSTSVPTHFANALWGLAQDALAVPVTGAISIDPDLTRFSLLTFLPPAAAFWLALQLGRDGRRARNLVIGIGLISGLYAAYALLALQWFPETLLWFTKVAYVPFATSTFVNRNSYATYAGLGALSCLSALSGQFAGGSARTSSVWRRWATLLLTQGALIPATLVFSLCLNLIALMLTGSRAGIVCSLLAFAVFFFVSAWRTGFRWIQLATLAAVGLITLFIVSGFDNLVSSRLAEQGLIDQVRWAIAKLSWTALTDRPLFGFGFGTFEEAFRIYRDASVVATPRVDKAHNSFIEAALGLGVPAFAMVMSGLVMLVFTCMKGVRARRKNAEIPILAVAASVLVATHALVDFSLQIQGVAVTFAMILGVGVSQSWPQAAARPGE